MDTSRTKRGIAGTFTTFIIIALAAASVWWFWDKERIEAEISGPLGSGILVPFRTPGGSLQTNGITKTEEMRKESGNWRGTTSSGIRLNATYRYEIELRKSWNIHIDEARGMAFVVAPPITPQLPVAVDSKSIQTWTESGWLKWDKTEHLEELRKEMSRLLQTKAKSDGYLDLSREQARKTVEEFTKDWIIRNRHTEILSGFIVKVYFSDEDDIPFPDGKSLADFIP